MRDRQTHLPGISFRFVPLPRDSFLPPSASSRAYREFPSSPAASFFARLFMMIGYQRNRAHDNIRIEEWNFDESSNDNVCTISNDTICHLPRFLSKKNNNIRAIQTEFYLGQTNTRALSEMSSNTTKNKLFKQKLINWNSFFIKF